MLNGVLATWCKIVKLNDKEIYTDFQGGSYFIIFYILGTTQLLLFLWENKRILFFENAVFCSRFFFLCIGVKKGEKKTT